MFIWTMVRRKGHALHTEGASLLALLPVAWQLVELGSCSFVTCYGNEMTQVTLVPSKGMRMKIVCQPLRDVDRPATVYVCGADDTLDKRIVTSSPSARTQIRAEVTAHEAAALRNMLTQYLSDLDALAHVGSFC